jgi:hypothetical protein
LERLYTSYKDRVGFLFVYIHEAHASDEWQMPDNEKEGVVFVQPTTLSQRRDVARQACQRMDLSIPCVVDEVDNRVDSAYAAWPERMFVIDLAGRIAYVGQQGPWGFKPGEVEHWLRKNVGPAK